MHLHKTTGVIVVIAPVVFVLISRTGRLVSSDLLSCRFWLLGWNIHAGEFVELRLSDGLAVAVECCSKLYCETTDVEVACDDTAFLEGEGVLHKEVALYLAPEVDVLAHDVTLDDSRLAYNHAAL